MNKVLQNTLAVLGGIALGVGGFYLYMSSAALTDDVTVSLTVAGTLSISDDGIDFSIAALAPEVVDTGEVNTITVASNDANGFITTILAADLDDNPGKLCVEDGGAPGSCAVGAENTFDLDGTSSYVSFTTDAGAGGLGALSGATFTGSETKLTTTASTLFTATEETNSDTFDIHYDAYADNTIQAGAEFEGNFTFTIAGL